MAALDCLQKRWDQAQERYIRVIETSDAYRKQFTPDPMQLLHAIKNLTFLLKRQGDAVDAADSVTQPPEGTGEPPSVASPTPSSTPTAPTRDGRAARIQALEARAIKESKRFTLDAMERVAKTQEGCVDTVGGFYWCRYLGGQGRPSCQCAHVVLLTFLKCWPVVVTAYGLPPWTCCTVDRRGIGIVCDHACTLQDVWGAIMLEPDEECTTHITYSIVTLGQPYCLWQWLLMLFDSWCRFNKILRVLGTNRGVWPPMCRVPTALWVSCMFSSQRWTGLRRNGPSSSPWYVHWSACPSA